MPSIPSSVAFVRRIAFLEGVSFLLLLGIAMPLKYFAGMPAAVKYVGWAHGLLFILLGGGLVWSLMTTTWPMKRAALVFLASLFPLWPFFLDRRAEMWNAEPA